MEGYEDVEDVEGYETQATECEVGQRETRGADAAVQNGLTGRAAALLAEDSAAQALSQADASATVRVTTWRSLLRQEDGLLHVDDWYSRREYGAIVCMAWRRAHVTDGWVVSSEHRLAQDGVAGWRRRGCRGLRRGRSGAAGPGAGGDADGCRGAGRSERGDHR